MSNTFPNHVTIFIDPDGTACYEDIKFVNHEYAFFDDGSFEFKGYLRGYDPDENEILTRPTPSYIRANKNVSVVVVDL